MLVIKMIIYIVEDTIHLIYKKKLITAKFKNCIQKGYIVDREIFMQEFMKLVKKEKIKNKLFGDSITVVNNGYFTKGDLFFLESVFSELGYIKVIFMDIRELLPMDDAIYIEINNSYLVFYLDDVIYLDLNYFKDIPKIIEYFKGFLNKNIVLFGINKCITKVHLNNMQIYYVENYEYYITQSLLKVKISEV